MRVTLAGLCLLAVAFASEQAPSIGAVEDDIRRELAGARVPGAAIAIVSGDEAVARAYGVAGHESSTPMRSATLLHSGSITKLFTALAVAAVLDSRGVPLDAPIGKHMSGLAPRMARTTFHQLLSQTSGLRDRPGDTGSDDESALAASTRRNRTRPLSRTSEAGGLRTRVRVTARGGRCTSLPALRPVGVRSYAAHIIEAMPASRGQYLVTRPHPGSGIGSNLASLAGAVWVARQLQRTVIVDWRGSAFLKDKSANYFTSFFECPSEIQGLAIRYAPCEPLEEGVPEHEIGVSAAREAMRLGSSEHPVLVIRDYHGLERVDSKGREAAQFWLLRDFYRYIQPQRFITEEIDRFAAAHFHNHFVVGVNLSTGNGEFDRGQYYANRVDMQIFSREQRFLRKVERARTLAVRGLPRYLRKDARIFFATDSYAMHGLLQRLPNAVTRRTVFPPPGVGRVFCDYNDPGYTDRDAIMDAIVDMMLLARCQALVRNGSVFNQYAATVTNFFNGNIRHIETLYARYWVRAAYGYAKRTVRR